MPDIRYVCLSDMHLGAQNSLLTNLTPNNATSDPSVASPVLTSLVECLRELLSHNEGPEKPTLILAGDVLELALTTDNVAAMAFERFVELILPPDKAKWLFKDIVYIPGNHDHHLWETARETQYVKYLQTPQQRPGEFLDIPWHATSMFNPIPVPSSLRIPIPGPWKRLFETSSEPTLRSLRTSFLSRKRLHRDFNQQLRLVSLKLR